MLAICLMQWPAAFFLMVRPDTWSDHKRWHIWELIRKEDKWKQEMQHHGINMHHELQKGSSEFRQFSTRFKLPALKLREVSWKVGNIYAARISCSYAAAWVSGCFGPRSRFLATS